MKPLPDYQMSLLPGVGGLPPEVANFPRFRYMGSKFRLLPWIHETLAGIGFDTAIDAFSGSGVISYLLKAMGKQVRANDTLVFPAVLSSATVANSSVRLDGVDLEFLLAAKAGSNAERFVRSTYDGIFYTSAELAFIDDLWAGIRRIDSPYKRAMALAALLRSAIKRQPRGLFTVGDPTRYQDGRRDLQLNISEHFIEQVTAYNAAVFSNGRRHSVTCGDVFEVKPGSDLVYLDPPYVPNSDDNCYIKRYHFLEGLACYWEGKDVLMNTKVRKIAKHFTPFSYRHTALDAFERLFRHFADSIQLLSYSSNAYPDLATLRSLMGRYKRNVEVREREHRYHFGTHSAARRNVAQEYLIIGS